MCCSPKDTTLWTRNSSRISRNLKKATATPRDGTHHLHTPAAIPNNNIISSSSSAMNLSAAALTLLSLTAVSTASPSTAKASKGKALKTLPSLSYYSYSHSSKASKNHKASKGLSLSYSMSMVDTCPRLSFEYDTGALEGKDYNIKPELPGSGQPYNYFSGPANPDDGVCTPESNDSGIVNFYADNQSAPDGTVSRCTYKACYDEDCAPDCCCSNVMLFMVSD